jgi:membrane protease YdiL (CAAX protease family)
MPARPDRRDHSLPIFFAVVFGTTWLFQLPAILAQRGYLSGPVDRYLPLAVFGYFAPTIAALLLSRRDCGGEGVRALLRRFGAWRVAPHWYILALAHSAAILIVATTLARLITRSPVAGFFYPPVAPAHVAAMFVVPFTEQIAWRGFVYPPLERRFGPLGASLVVGVAWALFHLQKQALLGPGLPLDVALSELALMIAGTTVFTWFYRRTGSMLLVVVANAGVYLDNSTYALPTTVAPLIVHALGYCAAAVGLVLADGPAWRAVDRTQARAAMWPPPAV